MSIAIVASALANKPLSGGFAWVPLSYALGLRRLGFDVYLVEQIRGAACVDAAGLPAAFEDSVNRGFFLEVVGDFGFGDRSALLHEGGAAAGIDGARLREVAAEAEVLVNVSGHATHDWLVEGPRRSAYIDTDPGFTQIWNRDGLLHPTLPRHGHHFSVGCNLGRAGCRVPSDGIRWRPLPPPVVLDHWPAAGPAAPTAPRFTTVATWRCPSGAVSLDGEGYLPSKLHEFRRMLRLPSLVAGAAFEIALDIHPADAADRESLRRCGWELVDPRAVAGDPNAFRAYVAASAAEFSTVQGVYAAGATGWISDRSARYLASGRPVLVQDTGLPEGLAGGEGLLTFSTLEEARRGAERILADYEAHSAAARQIAETHLDSDRVLGEMLDQMGARP